MTKTVIGIRFKKAGKIYYFDPMGEAFVRNDHAVVETVQGLEYGEVALGPREIDTASFPFPVKPIVRKATPKDDADFNMLHEKEVEARAVFNEKVRKHGLNMRLINVEYTFDKRKAIFYFTAEGRVDFRDLVKDLASSFRVRIELRQVGIRDEAKLFHTLGCCGRNTCCSEWLGDFTPVSIKMAKDQNLSLNSTKISGVCGRLLCCLTYENDFYRSVTKRMPKTGQMVDTPDGTGQVYRLDMLRENVIVKITNDRDETEIRTYALADINRSDAPKPASAVKKEYQESKEEKPESSRKKITSAHEAEDEKTTESNQEKKSESGHHTSRKRDRRGRERFSDTAPKQKNRNPQQVKSEKTKKQEGLQTEQRSDNKNGNQKNFRKNNGRRRNNRRGNKKNTTEA